MKGIETYVQISPRVRIFTIVLYTTMSNCKFPTAGDGLNKSWCCLTEDICVVLPSHIEG